MKEQRKKHALKYRPFLKDFSTQVEFSMKIPLKTFNKKKAIFFFSDWTCTCKKIKSLPWGGRRGRRNALSQFNLKETMLLF